MSRRVIGYGSLLVLGLSVASGFAGDRLRPETALEKLKSLAGRWEGHVVTPDGPAGAVEYRVTSGGNAVMEILFPGDPHEMVSMYYIDGDRLAVKHYCAMGNQPEMRLDEATSSENELHFVFTGGTNLDPARDSYIHGGTIAIRGDRLENAWDVYSGEKKQSENRFFLTRGPK